MRSRSEIFKVALLIAGLAALAWPSAVGASDHEIPRVVLHAPRGQALTGALGRHYWFRASTSDPQSCEGDYAPDAPFVAARPPVEVRPGAALIVRFHKEDRPGIIEIRGPGGILPFTLQPYAPEGETVAWDARFRAPGSGGRYSIAALASWPHEDCAFSSDTVGGPPPTQFAEWGFSVKRRPRR